MKRSGFTIMARLIGLVKPLTGYMLLAITMGLIGHLCAAFITVFGGWAVLHVLHPEWSMDLNVLFGAVLIFALALGMLALAAYLTVGVVIPLVTSKLSGDDGIKFRTRSGELSSFVLDSLNEAVILRSLHEERSGRTVVLVSHRKSTMGIADTVYSVEHGWMS